MRTLVAIMYLANHATSELGCAEAPVEPVAAEEPMPQLQLDCPHCSTEQSGFLGMHHFHIRGHDYALLMQCGVCRECIVARFSDANFTYWVGGQNVEPPKPTKIFPKSAALTTPDHLHENVRKFYLQGEDSLRRGNFDAAGMMYRKAIEAGLKWLHAPGPDNLEKRINALPPETGVTPAMKQWAHQIRRLGNEAAHEEAPFSKEEAESLQAFTELFLTYAFTLPGMLKARKPPETPVEPAPA
jgi:hypothetical protein